MKANVEAWQSGNEDGWDDGYHDRQPKDTFQFPENYSEYEKQNYILGYGEGYIDGQRNS